MNRRRRDVLRDERGVEVVEYLVLLALLALAGIWVIRALSGSIGGLGSVLADNLMRGLPSTLGSHPQRPGPDPGSPIVPTGRGVLQAGQLDPEHPLEDVNTTVTLRNVGSYKVRISSSTSTALGPNGESMVTLSVDRTDTAAFSAALSKVSGGVILGDDMRYSVVLPESDYRKVIAGERPFPDPGDLSTLPDGSKVLVRSGDIEGNKATGKYSIFSATGITLNSEGNAVGLEVHGDEVRVLAGPADAVTHITTLGVGAQLGTGDMKLKAKLKLAGTQSLHNYDLAFADVSRHTGQSAYEEFIRSGKVPAPGQVGVGDAGMVRKIDYDATTAIEGSFTAGPLKISRTLLKGRTVTGRLTDIEHNDGHHELTGIASENGVSVFENVTLAADGQQTSRQQGLLIEGVGAELGTALGKVYGIPTQDRAYDMQLELSQAQYDAWRDRAIDGLASGNLYTDEQIATLRAGPDEHFEFPGLAPAVGNHLIDALLYNKRVDDFMIDGRLRHAGSYTLSLDMLSMYGEDPERGPLPATVHFYDDAR